MDSSELSRARRNMHDHSPISVTAKVSAYFRQFTDIPFAREASELIGAPDAVEEILKNHDVDRRQLNFYAPMFEARYKSITQLIRASGIPQVFEIASGFSLRGLDLSRSRGTRYVETDLPDVIAAKLELLRKVQDSHAIQSSPLHVVTTADAMNFAEMHSGAACLDRSRPLIVLCEGLVMYLSRGETERLALNVRQLLREFAGGCWITPDFTFRVDARHLSPARLLMREVITGVTQRQIDASAFEDADELVAFLGRVGFEVQDRSQIDQTPWFSSLHALGLPPSSLESLRGTLRVWMMTVAR